MRPSLFCDFANTRRLDPRWAYARASTRWGRNRLGLLVPVAANYPAFDHDPNSGESLGLMSGEAATNYCRYNRDLTQAARWTLSNCTAAKNAFGIDGVASSASTLTATGANATALQTIAGSTGSATRIFGAWVRRKTGAGGIYITQDNGGTWTDITGSINSTTWARCELPAATVASPVCGFKLATSGDEIEVDHCLHTNKAFLPADIECPADADVTVTADTCSMPLGDWFNALEGTFLWRGSRATVSATGGNPFSVSDGSSNNRINMQFSGTGAVPQLSVASGGVTQASPYSGTVAANEIFNFAFRYKVDNFAVALNGVQTANSTDTSGSVPAVTTLYIGTAAGVATSLIRHSRLIYWPKALNDTALKAITS